MRQPDNAANRVGRSSLGPRRPIAPAHGHWQARFVRDDRVVCADCGRRMVPRVITYRGYVERTVCPFCAETHLDFTPDLPISWRALGCAVLVVAVVAAALLFLP